MPLSIVTTTRKFFSVFLSVKLFQNKLSLRQWIAAGIIFGALFLDAVFNKKSKFNSEPAEETDVGMDNKGVENGDKVEVSVIDLPKEVPKEISNKD